MFYLAFYLLLIMHFTMQEKVLDINKNVCESESRQGGARVEV